MADREKPSAGEKRRAPLASLILAVAVGGLCLLTGAWKALVERGQGEYEIATSPLDKWAYVWVAVAILFLGGAIALTRREMGRRRAEKPSKRPR